MSGRTVRPRRGHAAWVKTVSDDLFTDDGVFGGISLSSWERAQAFNKWKMGYYGKNDTPAALTDHKVHAVYFLESKSGLLHRAQ